MPKLGHVETAGGISRPVFGRYSKTQPGKRQDTLTEVHIESLAA